MEELISLLKLTQIELKIRLYRLLSAKQMHPIYEDGYLYAKGEIPILLVAHMDTVGIPPKEVIYDKTWDTLYNPEGILGGDDRCGIYIILKLLQKYRPYVLFTEDEEIGGIGALKAAKTLPKPNVKYIIEFDRKGHDECVFYDCGNRKFMHYIERFGFKKEYGTFSDICILSNVWNIASVNLSANYYNEHTIDEYILFSDLKKTINYAEHMLKKIKKAPYFNYQSILNYYDDNGEAKSLNKNKTLSFLGGRK